MRNYKDVIEAQQGALNRVCAGWQKIDRIVPLIMDSSAVYLTGVGKSGLVAQRAAATWASVGIPAHFIHPTDGLHGDMARIPVDATLVVLSQSGTTVEITNLTAAILRRDAGRASLHHIIALIGDDGSALARQADVWLNTACVEPDPTGVVPFVCCALQTAWLDAICLAWMQEYDITHSQFVVNHPGGAIGRSKS